MKKIPFLSLFALLCLLSFSACEREVVLQENEGVVTAGARQLKCPPATFTVSPCDRTFKVKATFNGSPLGFLYNYTIRRVSDNVMVDAGTILHNQNTAPVLAYCTLYEICLFDPCGNVTTCFTLLSDGCNNTFLC